jgi:hypothetical protein
MTDKLWDHEGRPSWRRDPSHGPDYDTMIDGKRIHHQRDRIRLYMLGKQWVTLKEASTTLGYPEASVSAQLRHLRKPKHGSHMVEKRRRPLVDGSPGGTWEYRMHGPGTHEHEDGSVTRKGCGHCMCDCDACEACGPKENHGEEDA